MPGQESAALRLGTMLCLNADHLKLVPVMLTPGVSFDFCGLGSSFRFSLRLRFFSENPLLTSLSERFFDDGNAMLSLCKKEHNCESLILPGFSVVLQFFAVCGFPSMRRSLCEKCQLSRFAKGTSMPTWLVWKKKKNLSLKSDFLTVKTRFLLPYDFYKVVQFSVYLSFRKFY